MESAEAQHAIGCQSIDAGPRGPLAAVILSYPARCGSLSGLQDTRNRLAVHGPVPRQERRIHHVIGYKDDATVLLREMPGGRRRRSLYSLLTIQTIYTDTSSRPTREIWKPALEQYWYGLHSISTLRQCPAAYNWQIALSSADSSSNDGDTRKIGNPSD